MRHDWLIDLLEEETENKTQRSHRSNHGIDFQLKEELQELKKVKQQLKDYQVDLPSLREDYFENFHDQVMAQIQETSLLEAQIERHKKPWRSRTFNVFIFLLILGFSHQGFMSSSEVLTQSVVSQAHEDPETARVLLSHVDSFDYYLSAQKSGESGSTAEEVLLGM